jgi:hypothetical protein
MGWKENQMKPQKFDPNSQELVNAWAGAIEQACQKLDFDLKCLDWFSYTPDFFIRQKSLRAA